MLHVATVITNREDFLLRESHAEDLGKALGDLGCKTLERNWLGRAEAFDLTYDGKLSSGAELLDAADLTSAPIDVIIQPLAGRAKKLLVADMDSTIIAQECIDEIADILGLKAKIAPITEAAMQGKLDFKEALFERVALLKGATKGQLQQVFDERVRFNPGARTLIKTLKNNGIKTALVSGGFHFFTDQIKAALGFDYVRANRLQFEGDVLTGAVDEPIIDSKAKRDFLLKLSAGKPETTIALGDGANDIPMFKAAGLSLCYHGKPIAEEAATGRIRHSTLKGVLYILGFRETTFQQ